MLAAGIVAALGALTFVAVIPCVGARARPRGQPRRAAGRRDPHRDRAWRSSRSAFTSLPLAVLAVVVAGAGFGALLGAPTRYIVTNETPRTRARNRRRLLEPSADRRADPRQLACGRPLRPRENEIAGYRHAYLAFCAVAFVALVLAATLKPQRGERTRPIEEAAAGAAPIDHARQPAAAARKLQRSSDRTGALPEAVARRSAGSG